MSRQDTRLYIAHAREMLDVAAHNLADDFYSSAVNRAYYAVFYAANALLATQGLSRSKHSGVIAAFRQYFVKPGHIESEYGQLYAQVMDDRHTGDYDVVTSLEPARVEADIAYARRFVDRVIRYLEQEEFL